MTSRDWKVTITLRDYAKDDDTGGIFKHLSRKEILAIFDKIDVPGAVEVIELNAVRGA